MKTLMLGCYYVINWHDYVFRPLKRRVQLVQHISIHWLSDKGLVEKGNIKPHQCEGNRRVRECLCPWSIPSNYCQPTSLWDSQQSSQSSPAPFASRLISPFHLPNLLLCLHTSLVSLYFHTVRLSPSSFRGILFILPLILTPYHLPEVVYSDPISKGWMYVYTPDLINERLWLGLTAAITSRTGSRLLWTCWFHSLST